MQFMNEVDRISANQGQFDGTNDASSDMKTKTFSEVNIDHNQSWYLRL